MDSASFDSNSTQDARTIRSSQLSSVPLRLRLAATYGGLASLALTFALIAGYGFYERGAFRNYDATLALALSMSRPALDRPGPLETPQIGVPMTLREYDARGTLLRSGGASGAPAMDPLETLTSSVPAHARWIAVLPAVGTNPPRYDGFWLGVADGQRWRAVTEKLPDGRIVQLIVPLGRTDAALATVQRDFLILGLIGALVVFGLGYAISGPSLRPLSRLARAAAGLINNPRATMGGTHARDRDLSPLAAALNNAFQSLRENERFVSGVLSATPSLVYVYDPRLDKNVYSNVQLGALLGYSSETITDFRQGFVESLVHPEDRVKTREHLGRVANQADGAALINEYRVRHADGSWRWFSSRDVAFERDSDGAVTSILGVADDITARKRAEEHTHFLLKLDALLLKAHGPVEVEEISTKTLGKHLGVNRCLIAELHGDRIRIDRVWTVGVPRVVGEYRLPDYFTPQALESFSQGNVSVINDVTTDPRTRDHAAESLAVGHGASISVPLQGLDGWTGILAVHRASAYQWRDDEIQLVRDVAGRVWPELERTRAAAAVAESRSRLDAALESSLTGVWELDVAINEVSYEGEFSAIHGLPSGPGRIDSATIRALTPQEDDAQNRSSYQRALETNGMFEAEYRVRVPGRPERWVLSRGKVRPDLDGHQRVFGTLTDITERKRTERALQESEERYRTLFNSVDQGFCICEMILDDAGKPYDYRFLETNPTFERQTGLTNASGKTARELVPGLEEHWFETYGRVVLTGEPASFTDGSDAMGRWFDVYASRMGGSGSLRFAVLFTDITRRRSDEQALRSSEERYRALIQATTQFVWRNFVNREDPASVAWWQNLTGQTPEESRGLGWLEALHPDDREMARTCWEEAFSQGTAFSTDYRVRSKGGSYVHLAVRGVPIHDSQGTVREWIGTFTDVTIERTASERLLEINEAQRRFVSDASHELRAPLTAIQGNLELLTRHLDMPPEDRVEALGEAMSEAKRMGRLVEDLLAIARGEAGNASFGPVQLEDALQAAWRVAQSLSKRKKFELGVLDSAVVNGNPDQLKQLALILLENAIKYTPDGGTVRLDMRVENDHAHFVVSDTGAGISVVDQPRVFERFFRAETSRTRGADPGGTGLGLTIAKRISENHGGTISLESALGRGTSVTVRLPLVVGEA
jgi:PAS domain S-box-containing protein